MHLQCSNGQAESTRSCCIRSAMATNTRFTPLQTCKALWTWHMLTDTSSRLCDMYSLSKCASAASESLHLRVDSRQEEHEPRAHDQWGEVLLLRRVDRVLSRSTAYRLSGRSSLAAVYPERIVLSSPFQGDVSSSNQTHHILTSC